MSVANEQRGEIELELAGETYTLRPSFNAIAGIRRVLGEPILRTSRRFMEMDFGPEEIVAVVAAAMIDKKPPPNLGELVYREGVGKLGARLLPFLVGLCNGGREGNAETPTETVTPPA